MTKQEALELIKNERLCVKNAGDNECDRKCGVCKLVKPTEKILEAYDIAIMAIENIKDTEGCASASTD